MHMNATGNTFLLLLSIALASCATPKTDRGGSAPEPSGVIEGTVLYVGQRPLCDFGEDGWPTDVRGNVVLLAFLSSNPPPPAGTAASASNLLLVPADDLFPLTDCLPQEPTAEELTQVITRGADFTWPDVALARGEAPDIDYQVRAFFDRDQDFIPFFSVRRLATRGDVAGGAFVNTAANPPQFAHIVFGNAADHPNGQVVQGVAITLGALVNTELPASELGDGTQALSSESTVPAVADPVMREAQLWELSRMRLSLIDPESEHWTRTLEAAGMSIDPHASGFGWFTMPVDANRDGMQDLHPILGPTAGVMWEHPIVIMRRARNPVELSVGIPDVVIVGTVRPSQTLSKDTFDPVIDIAVPPIAGVNLDPSIPGCTVPYIAPGNLVETYERIPVDCQEIPTGNYDINVLTGIAGGRVINYREQLRAEMPSLPDAALDVLVRRRTDNDWVIEGGQFSSQAWSIPNELGCPDPFYRPTAFDDAGNPIAVSQIGDNPSDTCGPVEGPCDDSATPMQCAQGPAGRFAVVDPNGVNQPDHTDQTDGHGVATCQTAFSATTMMPEPVTYMPVPEQCCGAIAHLCGLPLCPLRENAVLSGQDGGRAVREMRETAVDYRMEEDGSFTPLCVPFLMPTSCCGG
jgi:hypothetical protein